MVGLSKALKELCNQKSLNFDNLYELQEYIRNEKQLHIDIYLGSKSFLWEINNNIIQLGKKKKIKYTGPTNNYVTYEQALDVALIELVKLL